MDEGEDLFRDICENANDLIQSVSPDGRFLYVNRAWRETLGYAPEDLSSITLMDVIHPDSLEHCRNAFAGLLKGKPAIGIEAVFRARDGRRIPVEGSATCRFAGGVAVATRGIFRDVTERERVRSEMDQLFTLSLDLLCIAGTDGFFKRVNPSFTRVLGYSREELLSKAFVEFVHPEDREQTAKAVERLSGGLPVVDFQNCYLAKDGSYRWLAWRSSPAADRGLIYAIARDVTESKWMERLMSQQAEDLARSNTDLEQFAYVASHDLRAPLRAIRNLAEWIGEDLPADPSPKLADHLDKLKRRVARMEALTDGLLTYSRAGRLKEAVQEVDTAALVRDLETFLAPPEGFTIEAGPGLPALTTAKSALETVLRNLVGNALKHHHRRDGQVVVSARRKGAFFEFSVADDGPGIPEKDRQEVFQMFHTLHSRDEVEGSGIGLALVKRLVERYGGRVRIDAREGGGTVFAFTWPATIATTEEGHAENLGRR